MWSDATPDLDPSKKFVQKTFPMGAEQLFRWDKALSVADAMGDEEINRKLSMRKCGN
jgi:hypothetical protein